MIKRLDPFCFYHQMVKSGLSDNMLGQFDFQFSSDKKQKLLQLQAFIQQHYAYEITSLEKEQSKLWTLSGVTNDIPVTVDNLLYWALDMYKRGYEFDASLASYGAPIDVKNPKFPDFDKSKEAFYFDLGVERYNEGDLSGAIINWNNVLVINPKDPDTYYSMAIVKAELYTYKLALKDYDKAIELAPDFVSALINRGTLKDEYDDYGGAIEDYNKVIAMEQVDIGNRQQAFYNRGNSKLNLKDKSGACKDWKKAHELGADYALETLQKYCQR